MPGSIDLLKEKGRLLRVHSEGRLTPA